MVLMAVINQAFASFACWALDSRTAPGVRWCLRSVLAQYQQHREEAGGRDQILASFEEQLRQGIESGKISRAKQEQKAAEFRRAREAGEMPPVQPFVFITDYSPIDWATMLQSGGVQLLEVETLIAVRNDESVIRWGLSRMAWYQKLSDELIVPNLDQDISFFYDPAT